MTQSNLKKFSIKGAPAGLLVISLGVLVAIFCYTAFKSPKSSSSGKPLPEFQIKPFFSAEKSINPFLIKGNTSNKDSLKNPIYIIHFWASWCEPCRDEMPSILKQSHNLPERFHIIAVSMDDDFIKAQTFIESFKLNPDRIQFLFDGEQKIAPLYGTSKLPETYILDENRVLLRKIAGKMDWENKKNRDYLLGL